MVTLKPFIVWFEIYGKKLKAEIMAENEMDAHRKLKEKIIVHKIQKKKTALDMLDDILNDLKK